MSSKTEVKGYPSPPVSKREILRYLRSAETKQVNSLIEEVKSELLPMLTYRVCFKEYPVTSSGNTLDLGFCRTDSKDLKKNLEGAYKIVLFAATVGFGADRIIAKYGKVSPVKSLVCDAFCTERAEALCDAFNEDVKRAAQKDNEYTAPRFSAGYGDLPVTLQRDILTVLNAEKLLGITLNEAFLMTPSKSVTGIIGIKKEKCIGKSGCDLCENKTCEFRREV